MSDKPKPGGRNDRAALARAIRANRALVELAQTLIDQGPAMSGLRFAQVMQRVGVNLADQRDALAEMEEIRRNQRDQAGGSG